MINRGRRGYFYVRLVGCLVGASLGAGGFLLAVGTAAGGPQSKNVQNYDAAYPPTTSTSTTPSTTPSTAAPTNTSAPTISGVARVGGTLVAHQGTWTNSPTSFSYQWVDCNTSGFKCKAIPGATGSTYNVTTSDIGHTIRVLVTATNAGGHGSAVSAATAVIHPPLAPLTIVIAALNHALVPAGNAASINAILHNGGYVLTFHAPEGGTVTIAWYDVPPGATLARAKVKRKPILVAIGKKSFATAGSAKLKIKLTTAGKRLLKHSKKLTLTAKATFTPKGGKAITVKKKFTLKKKKTTTKH